MTGKAHEANETTKRTPVANRKFKDTVFRMLFSDKEEGRSKTEKYEKSIRSIKSVTSAMMKKLENKGTYRLFDKKNVSLKLLWYFGKIMLNS